MTKRKEVNIRRGEVTTSSVVLFLSLKAEGLKVVRMFIYVPIVMDGNGWGRQVGAGRDVCSIAECVRLESIPLDSH
jgi:hypothetical protein